MCECLLFSMLNVRPYAIVLIYDCIVNFPVGGFCYEILSMGDNSSADPCPKHTHQRGADSGFQVGGAHQRREARNLFMLFV